MIDTDKSPGQEFAEVGQKLSELGQKLVAFRHQRDEANKQISELESQVNPLIHRHTELISQMLGVMVAPVPAPMPMAVAGQPQMLRPSLASSPPVQPQQNDWIAQRQSLELKVQKYLAHLEEGETAGPEDIAAALKVPLMQVREVLGSLQRRSRVAAGPGGGAPIPEAEEIPMDDAPISLGPPDGEFAAQVSLPAK
jgi:hypothetical protein